MRRPVAAFLPRPILINSKAAFTSPYYLEGNAENRVTEPTTPLAVFMSLSTDA